MSAQRLDISGLGTVTGYGWGRDVFWDGVVGSAQAASLLDGHGHEKDQSAWIAALPDGGEASDGPSRFARAMRAAAREAVADARSRGWQPRGRVGLLHAVVLGEVDLWRDFYLAHDGRRPVRDYLALMPSTSMSSLMQEFGFHGPAMNVSAMCASGNAGLLTAKAWLDAGIVDDVVFVATDLSATPENVQHFVDLGVAVTDTEPLDACRPFQEGSRGFTIGEASVGMVLSRGTSRPYAHLLGGAMSHDAHHATSIDPALTEVTRCFTEALDNAAISPEQVRYLNAHGPGTAQCDRAEASVRDALFPHAEIYSMKPLVGHCQGAASAIEIATAALGYEHGLVPAPPTVAPLRAERVLNGPTPITGGITVKSSLGMGGHNSVVVLSPPE